MEQEKGNKESATKLPQEAIDKFPKPANFYLMYGDMEHRTKNFESAKNILRPGLKQCSQNINLRWELGQTLVQIGTEESLQEASQIFQGLDQQGKLNKHDGIYQRFKVMQKDPRARKTYQFFQEIPNIRVGFAGQRYLPSSINNATFIIAEINHPELKESFGLEGAFLVLSFKNKPKHIDIVNLNNYIQSLDSRSTIGSQESGEFVINPSLAFIAVPNSDAVRDSVMEILSERAIIPLDKATFENNQNPFDTLRDLLGQYIGLRDLYNSTQPVSGRRFFGREKWLVQLSDLVQQGQFFGIYGLRKMGKTSLIYQFRDERLRGEAVAYVDLQASPALNEKNCAPIYWELEHDLYNRLSKHDKEATDLLRLGQIKRFSDVPNRGANAGLMFNEDLRALLEAMSSGKTQFKKLVIVLDELERILPIAGQEGVQGYLEFFGLLRGLAQTERYRGFLSSIVVAANSALSERGYWEGKENPVFALYKPHFLSQLSQEDCVEMIRTLGKGMSVYWEDKAIETVFTETNGHPFITRLLCSRIAKRNSERPLTVTAEKVREEVPCFIRDEGDKLEQITELLNSHFPDEAELLKQIALEEAPTELQDSALSHLLSYQLISSEKSQYQISFNLLRRWLRRREGIRE